MIVYPTGQLDRFYLNLNDFLCFMTLIPRFEFLLQCPKCHHRMKYATNTIFLSNKRKSCVYCGKSYKAKECVV